MLIQIILNYIHSNNNKTRGKSQTLTNCPFFKLFSFFLLLFNWLAIFLFHHHWKILLWLNVNIFVDVIIRSFDFAILPFNLSSYLLFSFLYHLFEKAAAFKSRIKNFSMALGKNKFRLSTWTELFNNNRAWMLQFERQQAQRSSGAAIRNKIKSLDEKFHFSQNDLKLMIIFGYSIFDVTCFTGKDTVFVYVCVLCCPRSLSTYSFRQCNAGAPTIRTPISVRFH